VSILRTKDALISHNRKVHDSLAVSYDVAHTEIVNPTEQARISSVMNQAVSAIRSSTGGELVFLDFGAGTGNLTQHMLTYQAQVIASDISLASLLEIKRRNPATPKLRLLELNGVDLALIEDQSVDLLATYSVLHHVPDYLAIVTEFCRVVKPGGVIYIDHECSPNVWIGADPDYQRYRKDLNQANRRTLRQSFVRKGANIFSAAAWRRLLNRVLFGLNDEGDIHVTADDHIEWTEVERVLSSSCDLVLRSDYLVCRELARDAPIHAKFAAKCADMRSVIYRKQLPAIGIHQV